MRKARGSAIVIAIMIITAIGMVAFYFGRVLLYEIASAALVENGVGAYYAAESGIEEGFLRYRFNRNAEVPFSGWTENEEKYSRNNLSDSCVEVLPGEPCVYNGGDGLGIFKNNSDYVYPNRQLFDLRMGHKVSVHGNGSSPAALAFDHTVIPFNDPYATSDSVYRIKRDESKKFDMSQNFAIGGEDIELSFTWTKNENDNTEILSAPLDNSACVLIEAKLTGTRAGAPKEYKKLLYNPSLSCDYSSIFQDGDNSVISYPAFSAENISTTNSFKSYVFDSAPLDNAILFLKPLGADIDIMIRPSIGASLSSVTGPYSSIKSIGHFGGVTRTIEANIDRQSGTMYDLYDYVIYKASE